MELQYHYWLVLGIILMIAEMFVPTFFMLWLGFAGVVVGALVWAVGLSFAVSLGLWAVLSVVFCALWFWLIQPKIAQNRTKAGLGASVIVGETGMIVNVPTMSGAGLIRFATPKAGASEWACRTNEILQMGENAVVLDVVGNELLVGKKLT